MTMAVAPEMTGIEKDFEAACAAVRASTSELDKTQLLYFYSRFKQATEGACNIPKPSFFDFEGKMKWNEWSSLGQMTKLEAMEEYIEKLNECLPDWRSTSTKGWVSVSTMLKNEEDLDDDDKTILDWVKEGNLERVKACVEAGDDSDQLDAEGLSLLHWASDRGHLHIAMYLLSLGAKVNKQDAEGQTPLHYASACGHVELVKELLNSNAEKLIKDNDGLLPLDVAEDESLKKYLS